MIDCSIAKTEASFAIGVIAVFAVALAGCTSAGDDTAEPSSTAKSAAPATPKTPPRQRFMPGDGTYQIGGMAGRNWGQWVAAAPGPDCTWSVRAVNRDAGADVLNEGTAAAVDIEPDGHVHLDGWIGDHRIVFQTSGCGSWQMK